MIFKYKSDIQYLAEEVFKGNIFYKRKFMKNFILKYWPFLVVLLVWLVFARPYFLEGKAPYPATFQDSFFAPWDSYQKYAVPVKNNALSDVVTEMYPWKHFTIEELKKGNIPWWNPYSFSGNPHLADLQTAVFSPFNILFFIFPFIDAWSLLILSQPLLAGLFLVLYLMELKISKEGSVLASVTFMFCGFLVVWMPYGTLSMAIAFLPLALYSIENYYSRNNLKSLLLLVLSIAVSFFSGHFQISLYFVVFVLAYIIYKFFLFKDVRRTGVVLSFYLLGVVVSFFQLIPTLQLYENSVRSGLFSNSGGIPFSYLITIIAPDFYGNPVTRNDWVGNYAEWAGFIGVIPFFLGFVSLFSVGKNSIKKRSILFFFLTGTVAVILAVASPLQGILANLRIPVLSTSIPSRIIVLFSFSFAVLAGYGIDELKVRLEKGRIRNLFFYSLLMICLVVIVWVLLFIFKIMPADKIMIAARNIIFPTVFLFIAGGSIILSRWVKKSSFSKAVIVIFIFITIFDSFRFANKWVPFDPKNLVFPDLPVISAMQNKIGFGRVFGKFGSYIDTYYRLPSIEGYDPLYIKRYGEFIAGSEKGVYSPAVKSLAVLDKRSKYASRVLDLLGVNVFFHVIGDTGKDWAYPVWKKDRNGNYLYSVIYSDENFQLYDNKTALPRAKLFYDYEIIKNDREIIKRFYADAFDFRNKLILEDDPAIKSKIKDQKSKIDQIATDGSAEIISYEPNRVIISVNTPRPCLLFLSDSYYPKWGVRVNGKIEKIFRADYAFRAVRVPGGNSMVEFYYNP